MSVLDPGGVQIDASRNVHENGLKLVRRLVEVVYGFVREERNLSRASANEMGMCIRCDDFADGLVEDVCSGGESDRYQVMNP